MRVLLLGGTGAMGAPLARELAVKGYDVYITSRKRHDNTDHITYIVGNAMDDSFIEELLPQGFDVIIDFMIYTEEMLKTRIKSFLANTTQYIFLSSCRVYAPSDVPITEESPRLLDICKDKEYLQLNEYAIAKAKEENIIIGQQSKNWTIVRPSVTYNIGRMQLGCYELDNWLPRLLNGRSIVFQRDLANVQTPMTHGDDVAKAMVGIVGNQNALGEIIQIASSETKSWEEILSIYLSTLEERKIFSKFIWQQSSLTASKILGREYQRKYAKLVNREFDSSKIVRICGYKIEYTPINVGLRQCLLDTVTVWKKFNNNYMLDAYQDRITKENSSNLYANKSKIKYMICRYTPYMKKYIDGYSEE